MDERGDLAYWPLATRFLVGLLIVFVALVVAIEVGIVAFAYQRLGIGRFWAYAVLVGSLLGSRINLPVARLPSQLNEVDTVIVVFGVPHIVPVLVRTGESVVAVNVGGALIPCALPVYLLLHDALGWGALLGIAAVTVVSYVAARPVAGLGIVMPTLVPPAAAVVTALLVGGESPAAVAFVAGTLGTLIGADLLHLRHLPRLGAPVVSIGGAGTFDGIFVTGVIAVLFAAG